MGLDLMIIDKGDSTIKNCVSPLLHSYFHLIYKALLHLLLVS